MKKIIVSACLALAAFLPALAQKKTVQEEKITKQFDSTMIRLGKINPKQQKEVQQVVKTPAGPEQIFDSKLPELNNQAETAKKQVEAKKAVYIPHPSGRQQVDKDILPLLSGLPEPITSLPQAKQEIKMSTDDNVFTRYIKRAETIHDGLAERARQEMAATAKTEEQWKKEAAQNGKNVDDMFAANPLIQEMGGMEKLKNMSPEQRAALAKQMTEKLRQNPAAYTTPQKPVTQASREADLAKRDKTVTMIAIDKRIADIMEHSKEMGAIVINVEQQTDAYFDGFYKKLDLEYGARVAALPIIEMGEAGHGKDTYQVDMAYNIVLYPAEKQQALSDKGIWMRYMEIMKVTIAEYNELLSEFSANEQLLREKGLSPTALAASLCGGLISMAKMAELQSSRNASRQRTFDEKVLHIYE